MDFFKKINKIVGFTFLLTIFIFHSVIAASTTKSNSILSMWTKSYTLEGQKKYSEAANVIKPILDKSPKNEFALLRLGWLNYLQAKYNVSADYYHKALDANTDSLDARLGLTLPLMAEQRWKEAAIYANQVIAISSWSYLGYLRLMTCESGLAQWETLEKNASEFVKRYPTDISGYVFLARAQALLGKKDLAIQNYHEVLYRSPTNAEAMKYLESKK